MSNKSQSFAQKPNNRIPENERAWQFSGTGNMFHEFLLRDDLIQKEKQNKKSED
jgi:hypothetical protein